MHDHPSSSSLASFSLPGGVPLSRFAAHTAEFLIMGFILLSFQGLAAERMLLKLVREGAYTRSSGWWEKG